MLTMLAWVGFQGKRSDTLHRSLPLSIERFGHELPLEVTYVQIPLTEPKKNWTIK